MRHLHIWSCPAHVLKGKSDKLQSKTEVVFFVEYPKGTVGGLFYSHKDNKVFVSTNAKFLENDYMNNYTPRSRVVLAEINEPVNKQPMDETRDNVAILDTPQDTTHEMSSTEVPCQSGRIVRPTQKEGIDYDETFSPVAMLKSIRILLSIAAYYDYEIWQWMSRLHFLMAILKKKSICCNRKVS